MSISGTAQIISLGCGLDTMMVNFLHQFKKEKSLRVFEIDFVELINKKAELFLSNDVIKCALIDDYKSYSSAQLKERCKTDYGFKFGQLDLLSYDLKNSTGIAETLRNIGALENIPTLIITECVLVYIKQSSSPSRERRLCTR